jgi:periplasmic divalent cation tolerance protein
MITESESVVVLTTMPDVETARGLAAAVLQSRLAACVQIVPGLESHYWWQGKLDCSAEIMMILKTMRNRVPELERCLLAHHPYEVPEFVIVPIEGGSAAYLQWMAAETGRPSATTDGKKSTDD